MDSSASSEHANSPERNVLAYAEAPNSSSGRQGSPIGVSSVTFGMAAAFGLPAFAWVTKLPGYGQERVFSIGLVAGLLAIVSGVLAVCLPGKQVLGVIGIILGIFACLALPMFLRG
jgi:hypothetical protein